MFFTVSKRVGCNEGKQITSYKLLRAVKCLILKTRFCWSIPLGDAGDRMRGEKKPHSAFAHATATVPTSYQKDTGQ